VRSSTPPLSTPWSWVWPGRPWDGSVWLADGAAVGRVMGDRDHRPEAAPTRLLEVVADGCGVEHNDVDHNPARKGTPTGWCQLRIVCGHRGSADRVSNSSYRR
jgi:hypothetical protein